MNVKNKSSVYARRITPVMMRKISTHVRLQSRRIETSAAVDTAAHRCYHNLRNFRLLGPTTITS